MTLLLALSAPALATTLYVDPTGSSGYSSIQTAIDAASDGDTISVDAGTYLECIDYSGKDIHVVGAGAGSTTIDGNGCDNAVTIDSGEASGTSLEDLTVTNTGRGIYVANSTVDFSGIEVESGSSSHDGGAMYLINATVTIYASEFHDNTSSSGTIYAVSGTQLDIASSTFTDNYAIYGGAIYADASDVTSTDDTFDGNETYYNGGAIYSKSYGSLSISGGTFTDNSATEGWGGALFLDGLYSTVTISSTVFNGNSAPGSRGQGGSIYGGTSTDLDMTDVDISDSTAGSAGGGLYLQFDSSLSHVGGRYDNCTASSSGGAIYILSNGSTNQDNLTLEDVVIADNSAGVTGGGIEASYVDAVRLTDLYIMNNQAVSSGGGIDARNVRSLELLNNWFCNNSASTGGAVFRFVSQSIGNDYGMWTNNVFSENTATLAGGAAYEFGSQNTDIINNTFVGNEATGYGGALVFRDTYPDFVNNIVAYTAAGGGVYAYDSGSATNSNFQYNDWYMNTGGDRTGRFSFSTTSSGNTTAAPDFTSYSQDGDCTNDTLFLSSTSTLIDAGDPTLYDVDGSVSDIGAFGGPGASIYDSDGDGFYSNEDCDDSDANSYPGATEYCDGVDNDCDGDTDEDDAADASTWYVDSDGDGQGSATGTYDACDAPSGYVDNTDDCDDSDSTTYVGAAEVAYDGVDQDCDGVDLTDVDGDGYDDASVGGLDCDDSDADVYPGASETWYDGVDGDCGGDSDYDADQDTYDSSAHGGTDCDDSDTNVYPGATEYCDGVDNDCDGTTDEDDAADAGTWYYDYDGDGYGNPDNSYAGCTQPARAVSDASDCDDANNTISPDADEICDGVDNDCDGDVDDDDASVDVSTGGEWYADGDGDGYGDPGAALQACEQPSGTVEDDTDCDDGDSAISPDADEVCDLIDNDCDGDIDEDDAVDAATWYVDGDGDGYGVERYTTLACDQPDGYAAEAGDCDDGDTAFYPGAEESDCSDPNDYNCDGSVGYADLDEDGWAACEECDDSVAAINPDAEEVCDGVDNDCDGAVDGPDAADVSSWSFDADGDGYGDPENLIDACEQPDDAVEDASDCDDSDASIYPGATEIPNDGIDQDCDGDDGGAVGDDTGDGGNNKDDDGGCSTTGSGTSNALTLLGLLGMAAAMRRRRRT